MMHDRFEELTKVRDISQIVQPAGLCSSLRWTIAVIEIWLHTNVHSLFRSPSRLRFVSCLSALSETLQPSESSLLAYRVRPYWQKLSFWQSI